jgi:hypothetical protein
MLSSVVISSKNREALSRALLSTTRKLDHITVQDAELALNASIQDALALPLCAQPINGDALAVVNVSIIRSAKATLEQASVARSSSHSARTITSVRHDYVTSRRQEIMPTRSVTVTPPTQQHEQEDDDALYPNRVFQ